MVWYNPLCWFSSCEEERAITATNTFGPSMMEVEEGGFHLIGEFNPGKSLNLSPPISCPPTFRIASPYCRLRPSLHCTAPGRCLWGKRLEEMEEHTLSETPTASGPGDGNGGGAVAPPPPLLQLQSPAVRVGEVTAEHSSGILRSPSPLSHGDCCWPI